VSAPSDDEMLSRARNLRKDMTPQERKLWYMFLRKYPTKFYRQRIIESYIVDFYCPAAKLAIELDGSQHYETQGIISDTKRTHVLEQHGIQVLRFSNTEVNNNFNQVCNKIDIVVHDRLGIEV
jgi:very-short-patch-repair endonuclease